MGTGFKQAFLMGFGLGLATTKTAVVTEIVKDEYLVERCLYRREGTTEGLQQVGPH